MSLDTLRHCRPSPLVLGTAILCAGVVLVGCATLPTNFSRPKSFALPDTNDTALGRASAAPRAKHPGQSGFHLLANGLNAFVARAVLAESAERSIDAQYYLYHDDLVGRLFTHLLVSAADRGVRVRLLVDDMDLAGRDHGVAAMDAHPHIEVRVFNPFSRNVSRTSQFLTRMGSVTRRMHNKSFTVDNQVTVLGGRNIGNEYFDADPALAFADLDVMGVGPVAKRVSSVFDRYWNSKLAYPVSVLVDKPPTPSQVKQRRAQLDSYVAAQKDSQYLKRLRNSKLARGIREHRLELHWGQAQVVFDRPEKLLHDFDKTQYHLAPMLAPYLDGLKSELTIFSPYFVPGKSGTAFLTDLAQRGIRVRVLTNSLASNDVSVVHVGYSKYRRQLLRGGVELYELNKQLTGKERKRRKGKLGSSKASLHAKSFIFDRKRVFIGSLNLDPRAVLHNTEIGVVIDVPAMAEDMAEWFDRRVDKLAFRLELRRDPIGYDHILWHGWDKGKRVTHTDEPHAGFWRRCGVCAISVWPIDSQL